MIAVEATNNLSLANLRCWNQWFQLWWWRIVFVWTAIPRHTGWVDKEDFRTRLVDLKPWYQLRVRAGYKNTSNGKIRENFYLEGLFSSEELIVDIYIAIGDCYGVRSRPRGWELFELDSSVLTPRPQIIDTAEEKQQLCIMWNQKSQLTVHKIALIVISWYRAFEASQWSRDFLPETSQLPWIGPNVVWTIDSGWWRGFSSNRAGAAVLLDQSKIQHIVPYNRLLFLRLS
jgi:hypothetical protein